MQWSSEIEEHTWQQSKANVKCSEKKLVIAFVPHSCLAALSYSIAASSAVSYVPNHRYACRFKYQILAIHLPIGFGLTPRTFHHSEINLPMHYPYVACIARVLKEEP
ncbi:hypothetical protein NL676_018062 [Syzygium grande]|nr:hypothetical protein NL676_018062 [Syzygium grande]